MMSPDTMDAVFQALASTTRRAMLDIVRNEPGCSVGAVAGRFDVSRIAVMRHLSVLEEAGLIISDKRGRTRHLYMNAVPIQMIHDRWTSEYSALWSGRMLDIKYLAEQRRAQEGDGAETDDIAHKKGEPG
ncbi:ArsR/SmtB family transcription factor [Maricaulis maris]|uniref:ArsR family transcriptional regulator n=1 Tax=Maricaulis maris TaxID=74318 RepID=A0A495D245_9PROT|nr:helix-turn-helix transcriptional regulator [Maricaulis maris]RKQ95622.1 ArsR family transcriptional regulator [Maricaulis maris]